MGFPGEKKKKGGLPAGPKIRTPPGWKIEVPFGFKKKKKPPQKKAPRVWKSPARGPKFFFTRAEKLGLFKIRARKPEVEFPGLKKPPKKGKGPRF